MDGDGNVTQISPHARPSSPAPANVDANDKTPLVIHHKNIYTGEEEWLHLSALAKEVERLSGKRFVFKRNLPKAEVRNWDGVQELERAQREDERKRDNENLSAWLTNTNATKGPRPAVRPVYAPKPKPEFLR